EVRQVSTFRPMSGEGAAAPANGHPDKRVPAIMHDGELGAESVATVLYLTDAVPAAALGPATGQTGRGSYLPGLTGYVAAMARAMFAAMEGQLRGDPMKQRDYDAMIARLEGALAKSPYLMGRAFTGADLLVSSAINFARPAFPAGALLDAYVQRCKARPAFQ